MPRPRSGPWPPAGARRFTPLVVGITGSIAKTSTKEAVAAVLGATRHDAQDRGQPEQRDRAAADPAAARPRARGGRPRDGDVRRAARSPTWRPWPSRRSAWSRPSRRCTCRGSERSRRSSRPRASWSRPCRPSGTAVLNADDAIVRRMDRRTAARTVRYGFAERADVRADEVTSAGTDGHALSPPDAGRGADGCRSRRSGACRSTTRLAAAAVGLAAGLSLDDDRDGAGPRLGGAPSGRAGPPATARRSSMTATTHRRARCTAALDLLAGLPGRRVAVLGEMLELGDEHEDGHLAVGEAAGATVELLVVVGRGAGGIADGREVGRSRPLADPSRRRRGRRPRGPAARGCVTATSCSSRRRAASGWTALVDQLRLELGEVAR